jgi:hypothetical protein
VGPWPEAMPPMVPAFSEFFFVFDDSRVSFGWNCIGFGRSRPFNVFGLNWIFDTGWNFHAVKQVFRFLKDIFLKRIRLRGTVRSLIDLLKV